ncbi:hypothetical protein HDU78_008402 [Chytriomyces hyalinus]|nr:hypothetical protein HDU78_008402 [Chytriomyces hyalinus]
MIDIDIDHRFKVILLGDASVGKTNIMTRFTKDQFDEYSKATIGVDNDFKILQIDGKVVRVNIWDTAGQERFRAINSAYFRGASGVLLVYDITSKNSFLNIKNWLAEARKYHDEDSDTRVMVIGNKSDLGEGEKSARKVKYEVGKQYADENGFMFLETSALNSDNVAAAFTAMCEEIYQLTTERERKWAELNASDPSNESSKPAASSQQGAQNIIIRGPEEKTAGKGDCC